MAAFRVQNILSVASRDRCLANLQKVRVPAVGKGPKPDAKAAVLIPLCAVNEQISLLYTIRSTELRNHSGQISFPGGKTDENETPVQTALRETEEEIGLPRDNVTVWGQAPAVPGRNNLIMVTPVIGSIEDFRIDSLKINIQEVSEVFTAPLERLCDPNNQSYQEFKNGFVLPEFTIDHYKIWGLTAMITHLFLESLFPKDVYNNSFSKMRVYKKPEKL